VGESWGRAVYHLRGEHGELIVCKEGKLAIEGGRFRRAWRARVGARTKCGRHAFRFRLDRYPA